MGGLSRRRTEETVQNSDEDRPLKDELEAAAIQNIVHHRT